MSIVCGGKPTGLCGHYEHGGIFGRIWDLFYVLKYIINAILLKLSESETDRNQLLLVETHF